MPMIPTSTPPDTITLTPIPIRTGSGDTEGRLALVDGELAAVLVRLDDPVHGSLRGRWFLESGFGRLAGSAREPFATLDAAQAWLRQQVGN